MNDDENVDYEVILGLITVVIPTTDPERPKTMTVPLPVDYDDICGKVELSKAIRDAGIQYRICQINDICCDGARSLFGQYDYEGTRLINKLRGCGETITQKSYIWYCPFCGKRIRFTWKNLGTFELHREKKEVCGYRFEKKPQSGG